MEKGTIMSNIRQQGLPHKRKLSAYDLAAEKQWRADKERWLIEHPGRTRTEYNRLIRDPYSEVWDWRRAKGRAAADAEAQAWERDHPGRKFPKHECGLPEREYADLQRWRRHRGSLYEPYER
jgi:hypothetical protein